MGRSTVGSRESFVAVVSLSRQSESAVTAGIQGERVAGGIGWEAWRFGGGCDAGPVRDVRTDACCRWRSGIRSVRSLFTGRLGVVAVYEARVSFRHRRLAAAMCSSSSARPRRPASPAALPHFGFRLRRPADIARALVAIRAAGGAIANTASSCRGSPYVFFTDPDGYEVEIWYESRRL